MKNFTIPFNKPYFTGSEYRFISEAREIGQLSGDGYFSKACQELISKTINCGSALLTHSCTAALEMCALLLNIKNGDEIIMPSYTFVSTANAFVLCGGKPVFVDIDLQNLCLSIKDVEQAISPRTKAIVAVHYAGVSCDMKALKELCEHYGIVLIEDAAQAYLSVFDNHKLGSIGDMATISFHETKNITCGEGGAIILNNPKYIERAEIIREKGTNRKQFIRGEVAKYTWVDIGSSYLPGELSAAFLYSQLKSAKEITMKRLKIWHYYQEKLAKLEDLGLCSLPRISQSSLHNGHMFYLILKDKSTRDNFIDVMSEHSIQCVFHYIPLHSSPYGAKNCKYFGNMTNTEIISSSLVRLPLWIGVEEYQDYIIDKICGFYELGENIHV